MLLREIIKSNQQHVLCSFIRAGLLSLVAGPGQGVFISNSLQ